MKTLKGQNATLQRQIDVLKKEGDYLKRHNVSAEGSKTKVQESIADTTNEINKFRAKHRELLKMKKEQSDERDSYFSLLKDNQALRQRMKKQRGSSLAPILDRP